LSIENSFEKRVRQSQIDSRLRCAADGGCDWNAGVPACMSAKHEKGARDIESAWFYAAEDTALQAGTPAFQSHPPSATDHEQRTTNDSVS